MKVVYWLPLLSLLTSPLCADTQFESQPWTKSFLETACSVSATTLSAHGHSRAQATALVSSVPFPDWQVDVAGVSSEKGAIRAEKTILSDLEGSLCALSCVSLWSTSTDKRTKKPIFFEMARNTSESGIGVGKHVYVGKNAYTQLFSYIRGGIGTRARWAMCELGVYHSFFRKQSLRCSFSYTKSFGNRHSLEYGYGSIRTWINDLSLTYTYRFDYVDAFLHFSQKWTGAGPFRSACETMLGLSFPLSL